MINPDTRKRVHTLAQKLFGVNLVLDNLSANINYRIGNPTVAAPPADELTTEYADALEK
jgi:hypothetical protein